MKLFPIAALVIAFATPATRAQNLPVVLAKLDAASAHFRNAQADLRYDNYTFVVRAHSLETGSLYIERIANGDRMGAVFFDPGVSTPARIVNYGDGELRIYTPGTNQEDVFSAGANQAKYDTFLTLGFGGSGKSLAAAWNITDKGPATINGIPTEQLDLVSKDPAIRNTFTHITVWIDLTRGLSVRQIFYAPNGDTRTADYTNIRENQSIDRKPYDIKKGAQIVRH
jgi:outer membrane lipoprotein-sorting protein